MPAAPTNSYPPEINLMNPLLVVGETLYALAGAWEGDPEPTFTYQWQKSADGISWTNISGETADTYLMTSEVIDHFVRFQVTATNSEGSATLESLATETTIGPAMDPAAPVNSEGPSIYVDGWTVGSWLYANDGVWGAYPYPEFSYEWQISSDGTTWTTIPDWNNPAWILTENEIDKFIRVKVTATNSEGSASAFSPSYSASGSETGNSTAAIVGALRVAGAL